MRSRHLALPAALFAATALLVAAPSSATTLTFHAVRLDGANGGTEPRVAIAPDGGAYVITNAQNGTAVVYRSSDNGLTWNRTPGDPSGQDIPTIDTDIVVTSTGRLVASELDTVGASGAINFRNSYSDDRGESWHESTGATFSDTDRQWFAVGPVDPTTGKSRVYILWHNLLSGAAAHNMWVQTSTDGGATFGEPVPTTLPGTQAYADLQCADSGGPSGMAVGPTGRVYVFFGTRTSTVGPLGGCGAGVSPGPFEVNVVSATRVWVTSSDDGSLGSWSQSLAVDRSATGQVVGMELSPGAVDTAGNVYVTFPESRNATDFTAAIKYVVAPPDLSSWSAPKTVAPLDDAGNILPHVIAGDPGRLTFAYYEGELRGSDKSQWYSVVAQTLDGLTPSPHFTRARLSSVPTYAGTAGELMAQCGSGPAAGVENGFACDRSADVYGIGLDARGYTYVTWPTVGSAGPGAESGTYVAAQTAGASLFAPAPPANGGGGGTVRPPQVKPPVTAPPAGMPATGLPGALAVIAALLVVAALLLRRYRGRAGGDGP
ncbi:MAG: repeat-like domain [Frankiaceae bacterium]|jgi:hypothetical protein|nr:repeat-like domain [Frankiaceae bacterium]